MKNITHEFTLIELLVVIGIIGILAVVLVPKVRDAMVSAKVTEAQIHCQKIETKIAEYNLRSKESLNNIPNDTSPDDIVRILAGVLPITTSSTESRMITDSTYSGDLIEFAGDEYIPRIPSDYFSIDDDGELAMINNCFGQPIQIVKRLSADRGTITLYDTTNEGSEPAVFTRIKIANAKLLAFSVDENRRIIGSKGLADKLSGGKALYGANLLFPTE